MTDVDPVTYISQTAPSLQMRMTVRGEDFDLQFKDKQITLTDPDAIKELNRLCASKPSVSQLIQKVDIEAAEKLARAHQRMVLRQNKGVTGAMSADMNPATIARMEEEADRMRTAGVSEELITELMTDIKGNRERINELLKMSDEIPGAIVPIAPEETATPDGVFAALAKKS